MGGEREAGGRWKGGGEGRRRGGGGEEEESGRRGGARGRRRGGGEEGRGIRMNHTEENHGDFPWGEFHYCYNIA